MRLLAFIILILVPSFAHGQDAAMRLAAAIEWPKEKTVSPVKPTHYDVLREATVKGVPLITYVGCPAHGVDGVPQGTMYCKVDWLTGYPNRCIVVSVPDGKGWHHGWELPCTASNEVIAAKANQRKAVQPMASPFRIFAAPAIRGSGC
jgi:hypothetical protein